MSKNTENENFDSLRRLMALKRHEQPPPGYFNDFSNQVILRIRADERVDRSSFWESLSWENPWLHRLWSSFEARPIFAGALGMAVCGILVTGIFLSAKSDSSVVANLAAQTLPDPVEKSVKPAANPFSGSSLNGSDAPIAAFDGIKIPGQGPATPINWTVPNN